MTSATAESPLVLVIDVGSSSARASLFDRHARPVEGAHAARKVSLRSAPDGTAEVDPGALAELVEAAVDEALGKAGAAPVAAVAMDTLVFGACGVDAQGAPVTPLYTYADTRAGREATALRRELDFAAVYQRTGCPLHTSYLPARVLWLARTQPDLAARVRAWLPMGSLLYARWFGAATVPASYSVASWSGMLDRRLLRWDEELRGHLHLPEEALPPLADHDHAQRGLAGRYAARWPALGDVPFFLAVGDGAAANVGSGCVTPGRVALTIGTSGAMRVLLPGVTPRVPAGLWAYKVAAPETLLGGALSEGGNVFAWATSALRLPPREQIEDALRALPPDGHGLTVLPFVAGERSPGWCNDAKATVLGLNPATTGPQVLQACLEAVAYRFAIVARLLGPCAAPDHEIVASGGSLTASPYWIQTIADVLGRRIRLSHSQELTSRGTAILALRALGAWKSLDDEPLELDTVFEPDPARAGTYQAALERQHRPYESLFGVDPDIGPSLAAAVRNA
jgi:gluconokinase